MYLARRHTAGRTCYSIRESYRVADAYLFRDLFDLGSEPARFIHYPGGNAFYIDAVVEDAVRALGAGCDPDEMEAVFWPFLRPDIRHKIAPFRDRKRRAPAPAAENVAAHVFDRRRLYFLKTGRMDPRSADRLPAAWLRPLQRKSRDEIEQGFLQMETVLRPREYKTYTYVIFNLQHAFHQGFAKASPERLDPEEVDAGFVEAICRLQRDPAFWAGMEAGDRLSDYLVRYAVMYFDHEYATRSLAEEYLRDFINRHRSYRPPPTVAVRMEEAAAVFGKSREALKQMSRRDLGRLYRLRAQDLHPDKGGDHDRFVKLNDAYHRLLRTKH